MDKNIPLSELIRIGAKVSGQCKQRLKDSQGNTCAVGAAYLGRFGEHPSKEMDTEDALRACGADPFQLVQGPVGLTLDLRYLQSKIISLNDYRGFTREQIADWLESQGL